MTSSAGPPSSGAAGRDYADRYATARYATEQSTLVEARERALTAAGALGTPVPLDPAAGATLAVLAASCSARAVVSVGSGGGVTGLWLLQGMRTDGVLTALDGDPDELRAAQKTFTEARVPASRTRLIFGTTGEVLPRLSTGAYDLVVCAGPPTEYGPRLAVVLGLLRVGGLLVCSGVLDGDRVADRSVRDPGTVAWRELVRTVRDDEALTSAILPVGAGLLVATKRS